MALTKQQKKHQQLLNALLTGFTTVAVTFYDHTGKRYTYKVPTSWNVQKGDSLVVDAPQTGMTCVLVQEVHSVPQLDDDADFQYKWAVQKVCRAEHDGQLAREKAFLAQMEVVEREHARRDVLAKVESALTGDAKGTFQAAVEALNALPSEASSQAPEKATAAS